MDLRGRTSCASAIGEKSPEGCPVSDSYERLRLISLAERILEECKGLRRWYEVSSPSGTEQLSP